MTDKVQTLFKEYLSQADQQFVCQSIACVGIEKIRTEFSAQNPDPSKRIFIGSKLPKHAKEFPGMNIGEFLALSKTDGGFTDLLSKSVIVTLYASWDENYRKKIAEAAGVDKNSVKCNVIGDLRLIRNCIVHSNSIITNENNRVRELRWELSPGKMTITSAMMETLSLQIRMSKLEISESA